jgi:hypothetical protein
MAIVDCRREDLGHILEISVWRNWKTAGQIQQKGPVKPIVSCQRE